MVVKKCLSSFNKMYLFTHHFILLRNMRIRSLMKVIIEFHELMKFVRQNHKKKKHLLMENFWRRKNVLSRVKALKMQQFLWIKELSWWWKIFGTTCRRCSFSAFCSKELKLLCLRSWCRCCQEIMSYYI